MADNTVINVGSGGDTIATDDIGGIKFQRMKLIYGPDGTNSGDVDTLNPLPSALPPATASGNITTQNLVPAGTATAGSAVEITLRGTGMMSVQVTGTYTGALSLQVTTDGATWVTVGGLPFYNTSNSALSATITSGGVNVFQVNVAGHTKARISGLAAMTGTAVVTLSAITVPGIVNIAPLPTGANVVGKVSIDQTTPGTTNLVALAANQSVNVAQINGVTVLMGNGASGTGAQRVTLASDSTGQVTLAAGANTIGALTANQSMNNAQINGVTPLMGNGVTGTGSQRVTIASDNTAFTVNLGTGGTGATSLGKAEDAAHTTGDTGVAVWAVRTDTLAASSGTTGDYEAFHTDSIGALWIRPSSGAAHLLKSEDTAHVDGDAGVAVWAVRSDTLAATSGTTGDYEAFHTDSLGALWVRPTLGAAALLKAEDAAHVDGDAGVAVFAVRTDTLAASSGTTGDYETFHTDSIGALWVRPSSGAAHLLKNEDDPAASGDAGVAMLGINSATPVLPNAAGDYTGVPISPNNGQYVAPTPIVVRVPITPVISTSAYVSGDVMGAANTITAAALASGRGGVITGAVLRDLSKQKAPIECHIFLVSPTLVNADNGVYDITDANLTTALPYGVIDFTVGNYRDTNSNTMCIGTMGGGLVNIPFVTSGSANLFCAFVIRAGATYAATSDLVVEFTIQQF